MKAIKEIIETNGGMGYLKNHPSIKIQNSVYMDLIIEYIGDDERGNPLISVAHYYVQNGDLMSDPEIVFSVDIDWNFTPISITQSAFGRYHEVYFVRDGKYYKNLVLYKELVGFSKIWNKNIVEQGFVKVFKKLKAIAC
ncbi:MAG: hypothetical protein SH817_08510 [Leptospira sp.]|nr:hypothetical protein [Leptospira sp.]